MTSPVKDLDDLEREGGDLDDLIEAAEPAPQEREGVSAGAVPPRPARDEDITIDGDGFRVRVESAAEDKRRGSLVAILVLDVESEPRFKGRADLNGEGSRRRYARAAADAAGRAELADEVARVLDRLALDLPRRLAERDEKRRAARAAGKGSVDPFAETPAEVLADARRLLSLPAEDLAREAVEDARTLGLVGEEGNFLALGLATVSRLDEQPANVQVRGPVSSGKTRTVDCALSLLPEEEMVEAGGLSAQALLYLKDGDLAHRVVYVTERPKLARGQEDLGSHVFRDLAERGRTNRLAVICPPEGGDPETREFHARGPIALIETTTNGHICDEDASRMVEITPDDSSAQTVRVTSAVLEEAAARDGPAREARRQAVREKWRAAHRLMTRALLTRDRYRRPVSIVVPFAAQLAPRIEPAPPAARRLAKHVISFVRAAVLLRALPALEGAGYLALDGAAEAPPLELVATVEDYTLAYRVLPAIVGKAAGRLSDLDRRFLANLREAVAERRVSEPFRVADLETALGESRDAIRRRIMHALTAGLVEDETPPPPAGRRRPKNAPHDYRLGPPLEDNARAILPSPDELRARGAT